MRQGVDADEQQEYCWISKAALSDNGEAQAIVSEICFSGNVISVDKTAVIFWRLGAERNDSHMVTNDMINLNNPMSTVSWVC